jgi:muconolactone delta-isomerase
MPARKNIAPQVPSTSMVWPRSGWATSKASARPRRMMANRLPGISGWRACSAKSHAQITTKAGLRNSDGWTETPRSEIQRRAPLTSTPMKSTSTMATRDPASMTSASLRMLRGDRKETPSMAPTAGSMKTIWRSTKWNSDRPMRSATAGLAAKDNTMPSTIRLKKAARNQRSTVHHQLATGPLSTRLTISLSLRSVRYWQGRAPQP